MKRLLNLSIVLAMLLGFLPARSANAEVTTLWEQLRTAGGTYSSPEMGIRAEDFSLTAAASISQVEFWNSSSTPPSSIQIVFYQNADQNLPGNIISSEDITDAVTVFDASGTPQQYRTTLTLTEQVSLVPGRYWVAIYASETFFGWAYGVASSLPGSAFKYGEQAWQRAEGTYLAFRLLGTQETCPMSVVVANTADSGVGSLRQAIIDVCPGGTISFAESLSGSTITLGGHIWINKSLTIEGPGADQLTISGGEVGHYTYINEGDDVGGVFWLRGIYDFGVQPINVVISGLTIRDGRAREGGGIYIGSQSTLEMIDCVIGPNNQALESGGGVSNKFGTLTLNRCTVWGNSQSGIGDDPVGGGGIFTVNDPATTTLINSTVSGNQAYDFGGGILAWSGGVVDLVHSTVTNNTAGDELYQYGGGGGVYNYLGTVNAHNSIIAGNNDMTNPATANHEKWPDVYGNVTSLGGNLIGDPTGSTNTWAASDLVGDAEFPLDPVLGALAWNTPGRTQTMALLTDSPAIDAAISCEVNIDQRGMARPQGTACDIGAYELEQTVATGSLKISKVFEPLESGFSGDFTIFYDCGEDYWAYTLFTAGSYLIVNDIPIGYQCTVSESTLPTPPTGWSFGTPTYSPSGTVTISETLAEVVVTNTISQDVPQTGELKITKAFDPLGSEFSGTFAIDYDCDDGTAHDGTVHLTAGGSTTITGIPTGTTCSFGEEKMPTAPEGWIFTWPIYSPKNGAILVSEVSPAYAEAIVYNFISPALGELKISKVFDPLGSGFRGAFAIDYDCDDGTIHDSSVNLAAGESTTISGIPLGTICTITEPILPEPPAGWTFGSPTFNPGTGMVTVSEGSPSYAEMVVTNTISQDMADLDSQFTFIEMPVSQFADGTAPDLTQLEYTVEPRKKKQDLYINQVIPSTFFYYLKMILPTEESKIWITQENNGGFPAIAASVSIFDENLTLMGKKAAKADIDDDGLIEIEVGKGGLDRIIYIAITFNTNSVLGTKTNDTPDVTYSFSSVLNGGDPIIQDSIELKFQQ